MTLRFFMWIVILILANALYSIWKKEQLPIFFIRTLVFICGSFLMFML